ncbi:LysR family transcriptional regulator [Salmonella enterica subsp. enterica serovar Choleraesuis]|nr:LysR family transcriptional regulator [Salmonella enterica subsp. enterica serovar Choleraesuis]
MAFNMTDIQANSRIRIRMLRYFQVLADELHFGRAAARLNISQPPLSMQIKELEQILGVELFERSSRKVSLTHAGEVLKSELDKIFSATDRSLEYVRQIGRSENQRINIGIVGSAVWGPLLAGLKTLKQTAPEISWSLLELSQHQQIEALRNRTIDIAINRNIIPAAVANMRYQLISRESMLVALPQSDPLCMQSDIALATLAGHAFISLSFSQSHFAEQIYEHCKTSGFYPLITHQVNEPQTALALVSAGAGISLLPETCALIHWPGVTFRPLKEHIPADLYALWNDEPLTPALMSLLQAINTTRQP